MRALGAGGAEVKGSRHRVPPYGLERRDVLGPGRCSERSCCAGLARPAGREGTLSLGHPVGCPCGKCGVRTRPCDETGWVGCPVGLRRSRY